MTVSSFRQNISFPQVKIEKSNRLIHYQFSKSRIFHFMIPMFKIVCPQITLISTDK